MVGRTCCNTAPRMLKTSPSSQAIMNWTERPSALERRKFSRICGEKTTTQQAMEMDLENWARHVSYVTETLLAVCLLFRDGWR
jgi:hypothetical protein